MPHEVVEWWNFNVPVLERTAECPEFLLCAGEKDKRLIGTWDADYEPLGWKQVKELVSMSISPLG
jgi:hypothetical protein